MHIVSGRTPRTLDFDIENRPQSYWVWDRPTAEVTSIGWSFGGPVVSMLLGPPCFHPGCEQRCQHFPDNVRTKREILEAFVEAYNRAEMVTGHYIRMHDLPIINGALIEQGMPILGEKLTHDTKLDLVKFKDIPASQEYLLDMLAVADRKVKMTQHDWREANRLTIEGLAKTNKRVRSDVRQHIKMRAALIEAGLLKPPSLWRP